MNVKDMLNMDLSQNDHSVLESLGIIKEVVLNINNAVPINGGLRGGDFKVGDVVYSYSIVEYPDGIYLPGDKEDKKLDGTIFSVGFTVKNDIKDLSGNLPKKGNANLIKIYSTIYKIITIFCKSKKPDNILITSYDESGYFGIYSEITKNNKISGYSRKTVIKWEMGGHPATSIVLKRNIN